MGGNFDASCSDMRFIHDSLVPVRYQSANAHQAIYLQISLDQPHLYKAVICHCVEVGNLSPEKTGKCDNIPTSPKVCVINITPWARFC